MSNIATSNAPGIVSNEVDDKAVQAAATAFIAALAEARAQAQKVIDRARSAVVLDHPFFSVIMMRHPFVEQLAVKTLAVDPVGTIYYNPFFVGGLTTPEMVFGICHEVLHYASGHSLRQGPRDKRRWNQATDYWINDTLVTCNVGSQIKGTLSMPGASKETCEEIYDKLPEGNPGGKGSGNGEGGGGGNGDPFDGDLMEGEGQPTESEIAEMDAQRKLVVAEAAQVAKMKGKLPGVLAKFAAEAVESKTPWYDILERYMTDRVKVDESWARPNRRYAPDYYMPVQDSQGAMGPIIIQVDISGSVSRQEIEHYNGHMKRIVEQCRPSKVHVLYTDTKVQKHEIFDKPEEVQISYHSGGGTDMEEGFRYAQRENIEAEVMVTLTDGYTSFDKKNAPSDIAVVWCCSTKVEIPYGQVIRFEIEARR